MNRQQKGVLVQDLHRRFQESKATFLVKYKGLTVELMQKLRKELRKNSGELKVAKARLMKKAALEHGGVGGLIPYFNDQVGLVFVRKEAPAVAKILHQFTKDVEALGLIAGWFESQLLSKDAIVRIASLPSREVLLAQLCGTLNAPIAALVRILHMLLVRLLYVLQKIAQAKQA